MTTHDFQSMLPGTGLTFPYDCGGQCSIRAINPIGPGTTGGAIAQSGNGFVGLAAGTQLEVQFPSSTSTVAFRLWCGATPSRLEVYSSTGIHLGTRSLKMGPLGNGVIAFAADDVARGVLHHDNGEGLLLAIEWESDPAHFVKLGPASEDEATRAARLVFGLTGAWRAAAASNADLTRARRAVARAAFTRAPEFVASLATAPSDEELTLGTVGSIWYECTDAAMNATQIFSSEVATRIIETIENSAGGTNGFVARPGYKVLGPFEDVTPGKQGPVYIEVRSDGDE